jgi:hypothetical protein
MTTRKVVRALVLIAVCLAVAWAADVSGKWKAEYQSPDGQTRQSTFTFQVSGEKLTGTVGSARGDAQISEGRVSGDDISFTVIRNFGGDDIKFLYKGKVSGDEIKLKMTANFGGEERTFQMTAKREK